jgi:hypothetical protein
MNCPLCHRKLIEGRVDELCHYHCPNDSAPVLDHVIGIRMGIRKSHYDISTTGTIRIYTNNYCLVMIASEKEQYYLYRWHEKEGWGPSIKIPTFEFKDEMHLMHRLKTILIFS